MVPESNPNSKFIYYAKKPTKGESKEKLKLKKYNLTLVNTNILLRKITASQQILFFKISELIINKSINHRLHILRVIFIDLFLIVIFKIFLRLPIYVFYR